MFGVARVTFHDPLPLENMGNYQARRQRKRKKYTNKTKWTVEHQQQAFLSPRWLPTLLAVYQSIFFSSVTPGTLFSLRRCHSWYNADALSPLCWNKCTVVRRGVERCHNDRNCSWRASPQTQPTSWLLQCINALITLLCAIPDWL